MPLFSFAHLPLLPLFLRIRPFSFRSAFQALWSVVIAASDGPWRDISRQAERTGGGEGRGGWRIVSTDGRGAKPSFPQTARWQIVPEFLWEGDAEDGPRPPEGTAVPVGGKAPDRICSKARRSACMHLVASCARVRGPLADRHSRIPITPDSPSALLLPFRRSLADFLPAPLPGRPPRSSASSPSSSGPRCPVRLASQRSSAVALFFSRANTRCRALRLVACVTRDARCGDARLPRARAARPGRNPAARAAAERDRRACASPRGARGAERRICKADRGWEQEDAEKGRGRGWALCVSSVRLGVSRPSSLASRPYAVRPSASE